MTIPRDCTWSWRCVLQSRDLACKYIKYLIVDGKDTLFWYDLWCHHTPLLTSNEARDCIHLPLTANVSELISNGEWNEHVTNMADCLVKDLILSTSINKFMEKDEIVWTLTADGEFSTKSAYTAIRENYNLFRWHKLVWGQYVIPKNSFNAWQILSGALQT
ncbi:hypothetical protein ACHQM5_020570 [Ranunculus cassubicifolius]